MGVIRQKVFLEEILGRIGGGIGMEEEDDEEMEDAKDGEGEDEDKDQEKDEEDDEDEEMGEVNEDALNEIVAQLETIRKTLAQTQNMHAFIAANLKNIPSGNPFFETLVKSLTPPGADKPKTVRTDIISNVDLYSVLRPPSTDDAGEGGAIVALSAIESGFLRITAPGIKAYDPEHAALAVATNYLTALEGDFWVKLRGAGLTYGSSISESTDSRQLLFGLYKCTDIPAAYEAAAKIIEEYAAGSVVMSDVGLENAKSSLAYHITTGRSTKLGAAYSSFVRIFQGEKMDYDRHLLESIARVTQADAMQALVKYLVPIFDPKTSKVVATCPTNKLDSVHEYFAGRGWKGLLKVAEEDLFTTFNNTEGDGSSGGESKPKVSLPEKVPGMSMHLPGAFAMAFQCSCPRCDR